jgi:hypothetical protein
MSQRFLEWVAQRAAFDGMRLQMGEAALIVVILYVSISHWPTRLRVWGKAIFIVTGGAIYAGLFIFSLWALGGAMGLAW